MKKGTYRPIFTKEDIENLVVKQYLSEDMKEHLIPLKKKKLLHFFGVLCVTIGAFVLYILCKDIAILKNITSVIALLCFLAFPLVTFLLFMSYLNAKSPFYIECIVQEILPITQYQAYKGASSMGTSNRRTIYDYPIVGEDTTSGYVTRLSLSMKEYQNAKVGVILRIQVQEAVLTAESKRVI